MLQKYLGIRCGQIVLKTYIDLDNISMHKLKKTFYIVINIISIKYIKIKLEND